MSKIFVAPTGKLVTGDVLDVNKDGLMQALKFYDPQLYVEWNPKKRNGWGMWEVRRLPNEKTKVKAGELNGSPLYVLVYWENNFNNHIMDVEYLNYDILTKLKRMDTWAVKNWTDKLEQNEREYEERRRQKNKEDLRYAIKQNKSAARDFKEAVASGYSPLDFFRGRYKS